MNTDADAANDSAAQDERLLEAAASVAEGGRVDWASRTADAPELSGAFAELQTLARMGEAMRAHQEPVVPRTAAFHWGDLEAIEPLGQGASAEVWRAWDPSLEREVALKLAATGGAPTRSLEEARRLAKLRHSNVVAVLGADVRDGRAGIWMELVEGRTLEQSLVEQGHFGAHEATGIGLELCRALAAVHGAGLLHGDVSPRNVMRERGGRIVLMDLGSSVSMGDDAVAIVTGTPLVIAPEVLAGAAADPTSDLYSLGCLLFRLVTGRFPVEATTIAALREAHASRSRNHLRLLRPDLPGPFVQVIEHALDPDPKARPADAAAFERALARSLTPEALAAQVAKAVEVRRAWSRTLRPVALVSAAALLTLLVTSQWLGRGEQRGTPLAEQATPETTSEAAPPPVQVQVATPPPAAPSLDVAAFVRTRDGASERVVSGSLVRVGDELSLDVRAGEPLHVYVLNEDDAGAVFALFPVAGTDVANPVPAGRTLALPGARAGVPMHWQVSSPARRERFLIVAARQPIAVLEARLAAIPAAREEEPLAYAELGAPVLEQLRGVGRLKPAAASKRNSGALDRVSDALAGESGIWIRAVELVHEAR